MPPPLCCPLVVVAVVLALVTPGLHAACPDSCDCRKGSAGTIVSCRYQRLEGFPDAGQFPEDTVELDYGHNNISSMMALPTLPSLQKLVLDNCEIQNLGSRAFANVPSLRNITIDNNKIDSIQADAFQGLPNLVGLYMQNNNFKVLPSGAFSGLTLQDLYLEGNSIHRLEDDTFTGLSVQYLNMKGNNISLLSASTLQPLRSSLVSFHLDDNGRDLTIDTDTFSGFTMLEVLSLKNSRLKDLAFLGSVTVKTLYLSGNKFPDLDLLSYRSLDSVETLGLADMGLQSFRANKVLYSLRSLRQLDLSNNGIFMMDGSWFQYTPSLTKVNLASNRLFQLPENLGTHLGKLQELDLAMNNIRSIRVESFESMIALMKLDLRQNKMQIFPSTLKPLFDRVPMLMLEGNPLHCNCEMVWYVQWLYTSMSQTAATQCFTPQYNYIYNIQLTDLKCTGPDIVEIEPVVYITPGEDVYLKCVGESDPAPIVEWTDPFNGETLTISPNVNKTRYRTYNTWKLGAVTEDFSGNYTCRAKNIEGEVWKVTTLVVSDEPPTTTTELPTTQEQTTIPTTTSSTTSSTTPSMTSSIETTSQSQPVNLRNRTTEMTTARSVAPKRSFSQRTLAIVVGVVGSLLILIFVVAITIHICRHARSRRRYDVSDRSVIYRQDNHEMDISKDSKQIEKEEESQLMPRPPPPVA